MKTVTVELTEEELDALIKSVEETEPKDIMSLHEESALRKLRAAMPEDQS